MTSRSRRGEAVGIVGESGSGKSLTALAIASSSQEPGTRRRRRASRFLGEDLLRVEPAAQRHLLGTSLAMVFQDPMTTFNPTERMGGQLAEVATDHQGMGRKRALATRGRPPGGRPDHRPRAPGHAVPARVLRRHAAARDDRHGPDGDARR